MTMAMTTGSTQKLVRTRDKSAVLELGTFTRALRPSTTCNFSSNINQTVLHVTRI